MKKKWVSVAFIASGAFLICLSLLLTLKATGNKSIVGGADFHTFKFVFLSEDRGIYFLIFCIGAVFAVVGFVALLVKLSKQKKQKFKSE